MTLALSFLHLPLELTAADQVVVDVKYGLLTVLARVGNDTESGFLYTHFCRYLLQGQVQMADQFLVLRLNVQERSDVLFGDGKYVYGSDRVDVMESHHVFVLVNFFGRELSFNDLTENAIHLAYPSFP